MQWPEAAIAFTVWVHDSKSEDDNWKGMRALIEWWGIVEKICEGMSNWRAKMIHNSNRFECDDWWTHQLGYNGHAKAVPNDEHALQDSTDGTYQSTRLPEMPDPRMHTPTPFTWWSIEGRSQLAIGMVRHSSWFWVRMAFTARFFMTDHWCIGCNCRVRIEKVRSEWCYTCLSHGPHEVHGDPWLALHKLLQFYTSCW